MLTDIDRRCHELAKCGFDSAIEAQYHRSEAKRLRMAGWDDDGALCAQAEEEADCASLADRIIALRAAELAQGAQEVQP